VAGVAAAAGAGVVGVVAAGAAVAGGKNNHRTRCWAQELLNAFRR